MSCEASRQLHYWEVVHECLALLERLAIGSSLLVLARPSSTLWPFAMLSSGSANADMAVGAWQQAAGEVGFVEGNERKDARFGPAGCCELCKRKPEEQQRVVSGKYWGAVILAKGREGGREGMSEHQICVRALAQNV
eukprot:3346010-Amphidinium_carterae.10